MVNSSATASRRSFLKNAALAAGGLAVPAALFDSNGSSARAMDRFAGGPLSAGRFIPDVQEFAREVQPAAAAPRGVRPELFRRAMAALQRHGNDVMWHDRIAIADFAVSSATPRFHFVDLLNGRTTTLLVAHGSGSDPLHTGVLQRFSNDPGSNASCQGAFVTSNYYMGKHGRSQRLVGLDLTNSNTLDRAIVVHGAWYANRDMIATHGKLGRSQGCFAVGETELDQVFARLGQGRMIYSAKV